MEINNEEYFSRLYNETMNRLISSYEGIKSKNGNIPTQVIFPNPVIALASLCNVAIRMTPSNTPENRQRLQIAFS